MLRVRATSQVCLPCAKCAVRRGGESSDEEGNAATGIEADSPDDGVEDEK